MALRSRLWCLALTAGALTLATGCDLATLAYFMMPEQRLEARFRHLPSADKKKESRVVILTWSGLETRRELIQADRQLSEYLARQMEDLAKSAEEKLSVVPARKVEEYKNAHPGWRQMDLGQIGRHFNADHVIYLEINSLGLFEKGSSNQLFRGQISVTVSLVDANRPDDTPQQDTFSCVYPSEAKGPIPAGGDPELIQFRQHFLKHVALQLSWYFSKHPRGDRYLVD